MFSRQFILKKFVTQAHKFPKVNNAAFIHCGCSQHLNFVASNSKHLENIRRNALRFGIQIRHQSSTSSTKSPSDIGLDPIPDAPPPLAEAQQSVVETFAGEPSFTSLGLGGWTPSGWIQHAMEYFHVDLGIPWWGAVVCGTVIIRLLMFPLVITSQRNSAKVNNNLPQVQLIQAKVTEARQRGDKLDAARYTADLMKFMKEKDVNPMKSMWPPLVQAPVFISMFFGLKGMANLPVESLKTGGLWWFTDLTVPDQFYLLPIITSSTLFLTLKLGIDTGATTQNLNIMRYVMMGLPIALLPFIWSFPGLLLVYWTTTNFVSLLQVGFLRIPAVREHFGIEKRVKHQKEALPIQDKGFIKNCKEAWINMKITSELENRERADKMAFMKAGRDPIPKTYKYDPTQIRQSSTAVQAKKKI